ncbi:MAG: DoxX family protein [Gammaproteobacteria bacterium]
MNTICKFFSAACPFAELGGRVGLAAVFLMAGAAKLGGGYAGTQGYMEAHGVPGLLLPLVIALEIIGAMALIAGWKTRWFALALAGFSLAAALLFHLDFADNVQSIFFMKNLAIAGGLMVLSCAGAGRFSIDRLSRS